jgi:methylglutaconyl-CoA hydratase
MSETTSNFSGEAILLSQSDNGVARLTINRPQVANAFDDGLIHLLTAQLEQLDSNDGVRVLVLQGAGKHFSAGADLNWMRRMADYSHDENVRDSKDLGRLMHVLDEFSKPTIALVNGAAFGGGVGLVACCDIAIASNQANFSLSEVRLGLVPAVISPYVVRALGPRQASRYFMTGERFSAEQALSLGLVQEVVALEELESAGDRFVEHFLQGGPLAQVKAKRLVRRVALAHNDEALRFELAQLIASMRASEEGREGITAFLEKRDPAWRK